jgi:hypothetical protein
MTITNSYEDAKADRASSFTRRKTALVAGAVAFAVATLGLASAAGAAGTHRGWKSRRCRGCQLVELPRRLPGDPNWWAGERQRDLHRACHLVHGRGQGGPCAGVERRLHGHAGVVRPRRRLLPVERPGVQLAILDAGRRLQRNRRSGGRCRRRLAFQSATSTWAEIHDLTAGAYWFADNTANQGDTVVDVGTLNEVQGGLRIPTFTKAKFTNASVNGDYLGFDNPTQFNALNGGGLLLKTGGLVTSGTGSTFSETFKHAS